MKQFWSAWLLLCLSGSTGYAMDAEQERGKQLLQDMCAQCHAVGATEASPNELAPPFRTFGENKLYDKDFLRQLQDGHNSIDRSMPTVRFSREDAEAVVNYLKVLQADHTPN